MGKSLYAQYIKEREGVDIIEDSEGFATYMECINESGIYIPEIFIVPEARSKGKAHYYFNEIMKIALEKGKTFIRGSVDLSLPGCENSLQLLMYNKFKVSFLEGTLLFLDRSIGES